MAKRLVLETQIGPDPVLIATELKRIGDGSVRVDFAASSLSQWIFFGLNIRTSAEHW